MTPFFVGKVGFFIMLQAIRNRATGWIAYSIIILICIPFAFWGVNSYFGASSEMDAAEVGDTAISLQELQQAYQQQRSRLQSLMGENFNPALFSEDSLKHQALQQLIDNAVLIQSAENQGMRVSDQQLQQAIRDIDAFKEEGNFNVERYQRMLRLQGYTPISFEENLRQDLMTNQLRSGLVASSLLPDTEINRLAGLLHQKRSLNYLQLSLDSYKEEIEISESDVVTYYEENKDRFLSPEQIKLQYIELTLEQIAEDISVNEDDVKAAYQEQINQYTQEEERSASHILLTVPDTASEADIAEINQRAQAIFDDIKDQIKTFDDAVEELKNEPEVEIGNLGTIYKGMMEAPFEEALYSLDNQGSVSEPVRTTSGFHLIRLDELKPEIVKSFEEVREEVERSLRLRRAESLFFDAADNLANLSFENPDSLELAAEALGVKVSESDWITKASTIGIAQYPQVKEAAFSLDVMQNGVNSESLEVEPSHIVVIRKLDYQPPAPLTLDQARDEIVDQIRNDKARDMIQADIQAIMEKAKQGADLQTLADEAGVELKVTESIKRTDNSGSVDSAIITEAFRLSGSTAELETPLIGSVQLSNGDQAIIGIKQIVEGKTADLEEIERDALAERLTGQIGSTEFDALLQSRRQRTDIVTYNNRL